MRQTPYLDHGAGKEPDAQVVVPNVDVSKELIDIGDECCGFDKIGETCSRCFERRTQVLSDMAHLVMVSLTGRLHDTKNLSRLQW